jgi:hypothetical protein
VDDEIEVELVRRGAAPLVVGVLRRHIDDADTMENAAGALRTAAVAAPNKPVWHREGAIGALLAVLRRHPDNAVVAEHCVHALRNIAVDDAAELAIGATPGLFATIVDTMRRHASTPGVVKACAGCFRNCSCADPNKEILAAVGVIPALLSLAAAAPDNGPLMEDACGAMNNLAGVQPNRVTIYNHGGMATMLSVVDRCMGHAAALRAALSTLTRLAIEDDLEVALVQQHSGPSRAVAVLAQHGNDPVLVKSACALLKNCSVAGVNKPVVARSGAIPQLVAVVGRWGEEEGIMDSACGALRALAADAAVRRDIENARGTVALRNLAERHGAGRAGANANTLRVANAALERLQ